MDDHVLDEFEPANEPLSLEELTTTIVSAYVANNSVAGSDLSHLITTVGGQLVSLGEEPAEEETVEPAVSVKKSIKRDHLICLVCGHEHKLLKRHLASHHDMTPEAYREQFGLSRNYPMTAPSYTELRSALAKKAGLGKKAVKKAPPKRKSGRRKKASDRPIV